MRAPMVSQDVNPNTVTRLPANTVLGVPVEKRKAKMKELIERLLDAKETEAMAKAMRIEAEEALIEAFGEAKPEGTTTKTDGYYKVSVTNRVNRELDYDAYMALDFQEELRFVDLKPKINLKKLREVEGKYPKLVGKCVTAKPSKPYVKVEEVTE